MKEDALEKLEENIKGIIVVLFGVTLLTLLIIWITQDSGMKSDYSLFAIALSIAMLTTRTQKLNIAGWPPGSVGRLIDFISNIFALGLILYGLIHIGWLHALLIFALASLITVGVSRLIEINIAPLFELDLIFCVVNIIVSSSTMLFFYLV